jgi:hypothetical protein
MLDSNPVYAAVEASRDIIQATNQSLFSGLDKGNSKIEFITFLSVKTGKTTSILSTRLPL